MAIIKNIKRLKLEGKYNPIHCEEIYYNYLINNSINGNNSKNINRNHFITTFKGNTNYHFIHGYHSKHKDNENSFFRFSNSFTKNEENKHNSFSLSNISKKMACKNTSFYRTLQIFVTNFSTKDGG